MSIDFHAWDTYAIGGIAGLVAWLCKTVFDQGKQLAAITYYIERRGKDAAMELNSRNPVTEDMQKLLDRYTKGDELKESERCKLIIWLKELSKGSDATKRGTAMRLLTGIEAMSMMPKRRKWWFFGFA